MNIREQQRQKSTRAMLDSAMHIFASNGYYATTVSEISKLANVTPGLIIQRFGSKEELFIELFKKVLIEKFPSFESDSPINDALLSIVYFVKSLGKRSKDGVAFASMSLSSLSSLPEKCEELLKETFDKSNATSILNKWAEESKIKNVSSFNILVEFLKECYDFTHNFCKSNTPFASDDTYIQLFSKWNTLDGELNKTSNDAMEFKYIANKAADYIHVISWYVEYDTKHKPYLYLPPAILKKAGLREDESPEYVYKYWMRHVNPQDRIVCKNSIDRMINGEKIEFVFNWGCKNVPEMTLRGISVNRTVKGTTTRIEGIMQNNASIIHLQNHHKWRNYIINAIEKDYDFINYVNLGNSAEDDYIEEYKTSDFFNKITHKWEGKTNFSDRIGILINKVIAVRDRETVAKKISRKVIIEQLSMKDSYVVKFKIQHFGSFYPYEANFIADRDESGILYGVICCIRSSETVDEFVQTKEKLAEVQTSIDQEKAFNALFVDHFEAAYLVNLIDHSFKTYKTSETVRNRNTITPDFEVYFHTYVKRDVYFEDQTMMIEATTIDNIAARLELHPAYALNFRDVASGEPKFYKMQVIKTNKNFAAIGFICIQEEMMKETADKERLEFLVRQQTRELEQKNSALQNMNSGVIDLIGDIVELRRENSALHTHKIKQLTYILGHQVMRDHPEYELTPNLVVSISEASILHDIGKIAIPDYILYKPDILTPEEFEIMKTHSEKGVKLIDKLQKFWNESYYKTVREICKFHHERWDGNGYPKGLKGEEIPIHAQIVSVTDVFDALVSERIYKGPYEPDVAKQMILNGECGQFNPKMLESFVACYDRLKQCVESEEKDEVVTFGDSDKTFNPFRDVSYVNDQTLPVIANMSERMPGGFFIYKNDENGTLLYFNNMMVQYFGCSNRDDFVAYVNNSFRGIVHPDDYASTLNSINQQIRDSEDKYDHVKYRIITKNGQERIIDDYGHLVTSDTYGDIYYVFVLDITDSEKISKSQLASSRNVERKAAADSNGELVQTASGVKSLEDVRIMLVDDNDLSRFMTKDTLEDEGARVSDFGTAQSALDILRKVKPFDLILVDLVMPEMNGAELTRAIREWEEDQDIRVPIVAVTGEKTSDLARQCLEAGANGIMSKPLVISELSRLLILSMKEHSSKIESKLQETLRIANTDMLTGVKNASAYRAVTHSLNNKIKQGDDFEFGIIIADINKLKFENDNYGHDIGDIYIKNCTKLICNVFAHSPVYRIGGDEFAVVLRDDDLKNSAELFELFKKNIAMAQKIEDSEHGKASIAAGMAIYQRNIDFTVQDVIKRADEQMYEDKRRYKN